MTQAEIKKKIAAFRADLDARGESVQDFCTRNNLDYQAMFYVLRGVSKGKRGESHRVHVALGLKDPTPRK